MMFDLYEELRQLIDTLDAEGIQYALCGGLAMAVYDHPRATIDIDILIAPESLDAVLSIAKRLSYNIRGLDMSFSQGAVEIRRMSKIDLETGYVLSLDMLLVTDKIRDVWNSRVEVEREGGKLSVVSLRGLVELKKFRNSAQDRADIEALEAGIE